MKHILTTLATLVFATAGLAAEDAVTLEITGNDQMQYNKKELTAVTGQEVTIKLEHVGKLPKAAMGHNVVILDPGTAIAPFAMKCAPNADNGYLPKDEETKDKMIAHTEMIGGGETTSVTFTAPEPGEYPFLCTFPGHFGLMQGKFIVTAAE